MTSPALRARYLNDSVSTASPGRLLVMLYERLVLDLTKAETALGLGEREDASGHLMHAQDIIIELRASLDMDVWDGAVGLAKIYGYLLSELVTANVKTDATRVAACRQLIEPLLDAWRQAATAAAETSARRAV
jgi:flagellar secretion chaperone FliS